MHCEVMFFDADNYWENKKCDVIHIIESLHTVILTMMHLALIHYMYFDVHHLFYGFTWKILLSWNILWEILP